MAINSGEQLLSDIANIECEDVELMPFSSTLAGHLLYRGIVHLAVSWCGAAMGLWTRLLLFPASLVSVVRSNGEYGLSTL
jgi:hypothetical protein